jgi:hypothetical protein
MRLQATQVEAVSEHQRADADAIMTAITHAVGKHHDTHGNGITGEEIVEWTFPRGTMWISLNSNRDGFFFKITINDKRTGDYVDYLGRGGGQDNAKAFLTELKKKASYLADWADITKRPKVQQFFQKLSHMTV